MPLQRRRLLGLVALGTGTATAGCIDDLPGRSGDGTPTPGAKLRCPAYERAGVDRVVCSIDPPSDALVFEPDPERANLPRAEVECRLENDRAEPFETNFFGWSLHRYRDGEWFHLGPYAVPQPLHTLPPGETHVRRLVVDNTDLERIRPPDVEASGDEAVAARHGLGPGAYALAIESSTEGPESAYAAAFALRGDAVSLAAPETVLGTERDGDRRVVRVESTVSGDDLDRYDLTVRRRPDPPREPERMIREQLYHGYNVGLRAALANAEGVEAVVVRGDDSQFTRNLTSGTGPAFVEYEGVTYELAVDPHAG